MIRQIEYGTKEVTFSMMFFDRKTLGITVKPDGCVIVKAPLNSSLEEVDRKVRKRAAWILKQQNYFNSFGQKRPPRKYISGESHLYLGRQYILRVIEGKANDVKYKGQSFEVTCTDKFKVKLLMKGWYNNRAKIKFAEIAEPIIQRFKKYNIEPSSLYVQEMDTRWGSCTNSGKIILNTELIKAPRACIEYVITHELCHLVHRGHTKAFYDLLTLEMADWKKWKNKLEMFL